MAKFCQRVAKKKSGAVMVNKKNLPKKETHPNTTKGSKST